MLSLRAAFRFSKSPRIAFVGAGGKTTALYSLSHQLEPPVIVTTTTHLGSWQLSHADKVFHIEAGIPNFHLGSIETINGVVLCIGPMEGDDRYKGLDESMMEEIHAFADDMQIPLLIEADGSRMRPLKAPADHEPCIPHFVDHVVVVAGMSALGKPLSEEVVHRPDLFSNLSGIQPGEEITPAVVVKVLCHHSGGLKAIPKKARKILLLNQITQEIMQEINQSIALPTLSHYDSVILASLKPYDLPLTRIIKDNNISFEGKDEIFSIHERITGIILAAGGSQRFGEPKQIIDWNGEPLIRKIASKALASGLSDVILVLGAYAEEILPVIQDLPLTVIVNPEWQEGQSSSIRMGIKELGEQINAAIFILGDQPYTSTDVIRALIKEHSTSLAPVIAPMVNNHRGNPILFDRITFPELLKLKGNEGGRSIFDFFSPHFIQWHEPKILIDIDTPEDYIQLRDHWNGQS